MYYSIWKMRDPFEITHMSLPCPVCRELNEQGPSCRRCKADLTLLFAIDAQRQARLAAAATAATQCRFDLAAGYLEQADAIRHGSDVAQLQAVLALLRRDFDGA